METNPFLQALLIVAYFVIVPTALAVCLGVVLLKKYGVI